MIHFILKLGENKSKFKVPSEVKWTFGTRTLREKKHSAILLDNSKLCNNTCMYMYIIGQA